MSEEQDHTIQYVGIAFLKIFQIKYSFIVFARAPNWTHPPYFSMCFFSLTLLVWVVHFTFFDISVHN